MIMALEIKRNSLTEEFSADMIGREMKTERSEQMNMTLEDTIKAIRPLDAKAMEACKDRWSKLAKPIYGLGKLEDAFIQMAGIIRSEKVVIEKKALIVMCADNGVVEEGVSQTDSSVTAVVANNFASGKTSVCMMAKCAGVDVYPIDIGVNVDTDIALHKVRRGTGNIAKGPAMSREEAIQAIEVGIEAAKRCKELGYQLLSVGEMGIGNTTTSSAVAAVLLEESAEAVTGRGAGLSYEGLQRKQEVIRRAIEINCPDRNDPLDVLSKVGGLDIAGMTGVFLGCAALGIPIVIDGFIAAVSALLAGRFCSLIRSYALPSHMSKEPGMCKVMQQLQMEPFLDCNMKLGEGTGAVAVMPIFDMAGAVYRNMSTFDEIKITAYEPFGCH